LLNLVLAASDSVNGSGREPDRLTPVNERAVNRGGADYCSDGVPHIPKVV
jgi:hypothetical protein